MFKLYYLLRYKYCTLRIGMPDAAQIRVRDR